MMKIVTVQILMDLTVNTHMDTHTELGAAQLFLPWLSSLLSSSLLPLTET